MYPDEPSEDDDVQQDDNSRYIQMNHLKMMMYNRMPTQDMYPDEPSEDEEEQRIAYLRFLESMPYFRCSEFPSADGMGNLSCAWDCEGRW